MWPTLHFMRVQRRFMSHSRAKKIKNLYFEAFSLAKFAAAQLYWLQVTDLNYNVPSEGTPCWRVQNSTWQPLTSETLLLLLSVYLLHSQLYTQYFSVFIQCCFYAGYTR